MRGQIKHTAEHNQKISKAPKGRERSAEHCMSLSLSHQQESYKQRITATLMQRHGVDNIFKLDAVKKVCNTPEVHKKRFATMKKMVQSRNQSWKILTTCITVRCLALRMC